MATSQAKPKLLAIVGQTASGKSVLALELAKQFNGEIITADSWTVYKEFDIGTGKPTIADQQAVKHHMLDVRQATQGFNAALFKAAAQAVIIDIQKRSKLPILVGGTGLYIDSVLYDYSFLPAVSDQERARLNSMSLNELLELAKSLVIDLVDIDTNNKRRVIRAIEAGGQKPIKSPLRPNSLIVGIRLKSEDLKSKIEQRTDHMLSLGLEAEVKNLSKKYGWQVEPMKGIGYREWKDYFENGRDLMQVKQRIIASTGQLAKRQSTWFKRNPDIRWFGSKYSAFDYISKVLNT